jgi:DNA polymerase I-like protein with 3'-5' exonuclease and polymerase domains
MQETTTSIRHAIFCRLAARYIPRGEPSRRGGLIADIETDGLRGATTTIHCIVIADLDGEHIEEYGPDTIDAALARLATAQRIIGHNTCNFDLPVLRDLRGWSPRHDCEILDTLVASRIIFPHLSALDDEAGATSAREKMRNLRGRHSLEAWGVRLGHAKIGAELDDFTHWSPLLQARCVSDVRLTRELFHFLRPDALPASVLALEHRVSEVCDAITRTGIPFDRAAAEALRERWTARRAALETELRQRFPDIDNFNSRPQLARLLQDRGWVHAERTAKTQAPKIDDDALESIGAQFPELAPLSEYFILGRRLGQLGKGKQAWLKHVGADGRIHSGIVHIGTPHHRAAHMAPNLAQVPNPKRGKPFAAECRALFRCPDDWVFVCCDQRGLQDRAFAHLLADHDGGAYARAFVAGLDPHWSAARSLGLVAPDAERDKENPYHTALREGCKSFRYGFLFGAQAKRAGIILHSTIRTASAVDPGCDLLAKFFPTVNDAALLRAGKTALARFVAATPGLGALRQALEGQVARCRWLPGLDGRRIPCSANYVALNYAVTACEAVICKTWLCNVHDELRARWRYGDDCYIAAWTHDEIAVCCRPHLAALVGEVLTRHAKTAGEAFGFKVPLDAELAVGKSWGANDAEASEAQPEFQSRPTLASEPCQASNPYKVPSEPLASLASSEPNPPRASSKQSESAPRDSVVIKLRTAIAAREVAAHDDTPTLLDVAGAPSDWNFDDAPRVDGAHDDGEPCCNGDDAEPHAPCSGNGAAHDDAPPASKGNGSALPPGGSLRDTASDDRCGESFDDMWLRRQGYRRTAIYSYVMPSGDVLYRQNRYELRAGIAATRKRPRKRFLASQEENGRAVFGAGARRIPYNWPAIIQAGPGVTVIVTEGEKNADALIKAGLLATTVLSHDWASECVAALTGCHVIVLEDHDEQGRKLAGDAQAKLTAAAASLRRVPYLHLWTHLDPATRGAAPKAGEDVSDWLAKGGNAATLLEICDQIPAEGAIEPIDLWGQFDPPLLPTGLLPEVIEQFAREESELMGADPSGLAMAALTVCAAALSDHTQLQVKRHDPNWRESTRLWTGLIGLPSTKKTPIMLRATKPLKRLDTELWRRFLAEQECYEQLPAEERKHVERPRQTRLRLEDTTIEAAQEVLKSSPDGVLCIQDELAGWFGAMDKYAGRGAAKDRGFWLQSFHGGSYAVNRISRGAFMIENLSISLLGGIQPDPIRKIAADTIDDGLLQRLMPIVLCQGRAGKDAPTTHAASRYEKLIEELHERECPPTPLRFNDAALAIREELEQTHTDLMAYEAINRKLAAHIGKYDGLFARLCLLWHCIEGAKGLIVTENTALRVADFMHRFLLPHATAFYAGMLELSDDHDRLTKVAGYILAKKLTRITNRDVQRGNNAMRGLERREIESIFDQLEALGWLTRTPGPLWSKPPHWLVNPEVHRRFAERAAREAIERARERDMLQEMFGR